METTIGRDSLEDMMGEVSSIEKRGRPRLIEEGEKWSLQQLRGYHHSIILLHCLGMSNVAIAGKLKITPQTVSNTLNSDVARPVIEQQYERLYNPLTQVQDLLSDHMPDVVRELIRMFFDDTLETKDKKDIGFKLMDRGGHGPSRNITIDNGLRQDDLEKIIEGAKSAGLHLVAEDAVIVEEDIDDEE